MLKVKQLLNRSNNISKFRIQNVTINLLTGKFVNHKGRNRKFTAEEDLEEERKAEESKRWRKKKESDSEDEESESEKSESDENEESSESESEDQQKGAHGLIEIENPNRIQKKQVLKVSTMKVEDPEEGL